MYINASATGPLRDQEEGGELDSHIEACLEEIRSREVVLGWRVGLLLLQLFPNSGATDIMTLLCIAVGTAVAWCRGHCAMLDRHCLNILLFWLWSMAALVFQAAWPLFRSFILLSLFSHSSPSLIGLLAYLNVKQQKLSHATAPY